MYQYRHQSEPGCGGCLLVFLLIVLLFGGAPMLLQVLGFLLFSGLFSVVAIGLIFYGISRYLRNRVADYERSQTEAHNQFVSLLVHILVKIAQTDGQVSREETATIIRFFRDHLGYHYEQILWVKDLIREAERSSAPLEELLSEFRDGFAYEPRLILLELVYQVVFSGEKRREPEIELAKKIAEFLGIDPYHHATIRNRYAHAARQGRTVSDEARAYETLGLQPGATAEEIKKAYRALSMQYHPDKVAHLGEEFKRVAEEKMKEINVAYQRLKTNFP